MNKISIALIFQNFQLPSLPLKFLPTDFKMGLLVGPSGSGKTTLLRKFGEICEPAWDASQAVIEQHHFHQLSSEEAEHLLRQKFSNGADI